MPDDKQKHLEMIQGVITRLSGNSSSAKAWSVGLVTALFALAAHDAERRFAILAVLPALVFWGLDAYYLRCERLSRKLYDAVRRGGSDGPEPFSMDIHQHCRQVSSWFATLFSLSIAPVHGTILIGIVVVSLTVRR